MIVNWLPADSALNKARNPDTWYWDTKTELLAKSADFLHWLQWAKSKDAEDGGNPPEMLPRPYNQVEEEEFDYDAVMAQLDARNGHREPEGIK